MAKRLYEGEHLTVDLCCNNPDNGNFAGRVCAIQVCDFKLESNFADWSPHLRFITKDRNIIAISIARKHFPVVGYKQWYGNWCWDAVRMDGYTVIELLNWLKKKNWFSCDEGEERMYNLWNSDGEYDEHFIRILKKAEIAA